MRYAYLAATSAALWTLSGCVIESGMTSGQTTPAGHDRQYADDGYHDDGPHDQAPAQGAQPRAGGYGGADRAHGGNIQLSDYAPNCPTPHDHCLQPEDVFVNSSGHSGAWTYVEVATQQGAPSPGGEATYFVRRQGSQLVTGNAWHTRPADPAELRIGQLVVMIHRRSGNVYRPPNNRDEAYSQRWWIARVASLDSLQHGQVTVTGGYQIDLNGVRVVEGDDSPTASVSPQLDNHFISPDHWLVSSRAPSGQWAYVELAAPIRAPSAETQGQGHFVTTRQGNALWTQHAWATRPATADDLSLGTRVFMVHRRDGNVYRAPNSHTEAISQRWWTATVVDTSELFRDVVTVSGGYTISLDALRVPIGGSPRASAGDASLRASL